MRKRLRSHCPVNFGLEAFGDKWSLLILRDIVFLGKRTYGDFLASPEGFATNILASRLVMLVKEGILRKRPSPTDARTDVYSLTEKGLDLVPLLMEMVSWSARHDPKSDARKMKRLLRLIQKDNRAFSRNLQEKLRRGEAAFPEFLG